MKLMASYGALRPMDGGETNQTLAVKNGIRETVGFVYTEPFLNHFKYRRHQVDGHNNARHSLISLEKFIITKDWKIRVFMLVLALVEVNAQLFHSFCTQSDAPSQLDFRRSLARELVDISLALNSSSRRSRRNDVETKSTECGVETAPLFATNWTGTEWHFSSTKYPQHIIRAVGRKKA